MLKYRVFGQIGSRLVLFFSQAERSACVFLLNSDVTREREQRGDHDDKHLKIESQNAMHEEKRKIFGHAFIKKNKSLPLRKDHIITESWYQ